MADNQSVFDILSKRMGAPGSKRFAKILEAMITVEEAGILLETSTSMTAQQIADKLKTDLRSLQPRLDDMEKRQVIRKTPQGYVTPANIVAFHHGAIGWMREDLKAQVYPLWDDFFFAEWRDIIVDDFIRRKTTGAPGAHRIVPAHKALKASPKIRPEQVLWYEDMEQILQRSERLSLMMCGCRGLWRKCDSPIDVCLKVQFSTGGVHKPAAPNEFLKPPKDVTFAEALATIDECEDHGLVHIPLNTSHGDLFCNCCRDCCMVVNPLLHRGSGKLYEILTPSRYRAVVDPELCSGCETCVKRCMFDAVRMEPVSASKKLKSTIVKEHCLGCGVCVVKCPKKAIELELIRPPEHIPTVSVLELFRMGQKV
jgi:ferredoxin